MATYLLTWNPQRWVWADLPGIAHKTATGDTVTVRWSTGNTRRVNPGDRLFLLRQGEEPRGIVAAGVAVSGVIKNPHWDEERQRRGDLVNCVEARFERVLDPAVDPLLSLRDHDELRSVPAMPAASGFQIHEPAAGALEKAWAGHLELLDSRARMPEEVGSVGYREGAVRTIMVNAYERNPAARRVCIAHWGLRCSACSLLMSEKYGPRASDLIHVHHLDPLALADGQRAVDPIRDLRPVCPNCHAVMHLENPPLTVEQVRAMLAAPYDASPNVAKHCAPAPRGE